MQEQNCVLKLKNVVKRFGGIVASNNITLNVPAGSIYGIIGPNGAGKTTLFNMITGVYDTTEGEIEFAGEKINGLPTDLIARKGISRTFQNIRLFSNLTVYENLLTACQKNITYSLIDGILKTPKYRKQEKEMELFCESIMKDVNLEQYRNQKANNLPYGSQRRLEIARAIATKPRMILLDEPAAGMNEEESSQLSEFIKEIKNKRNISIIIIDHHMDVIMKICDRIAVLNFGTLIAEGIPSEIQQNAEVISAYLGVDE